MILSLTLALGLSVDFEVEPRPLPWSALGPETFDRRWTLPEENRSGRDLLAEMRALSTLEFPPIPLGDATVRSFGDLVELSGRLPGARRVALFDELAARAPKLARDWGAGLRELLLDEHLRSRAWTPEEDHPADGLLVADDWELAAAAGAPWAELSADPLFAQAATLVRCDLATLKEVENDYRTYPENVGSDYEEIAPRRDLHVRGEDPGGRPFSALGLRFRCDIPFPYTSYRCDLRILNRYDADGIARTDIYSTSPDFHYLAGRDVFLPVRTSDGRVVAYLCVRHFGFDLDNVPDRPKHRREALRGSLGNLKRNAEERFRRSGREFELAPEALTHFRVRGRE